MTLDIIKHEMYYKTDNKNELCIRVKVFNYMINISKYIHNYIYLYNFLAI